MHLICSIVTASLLMSPQKKETTETSKKTPPQTLVEPYFLNCEAIMGQVYGEVMFLQPNGSSLYYAAQANGLDENLSIPAISPNWVIHEISPDYTASFRVGGKLLFTDMQTNLEVNWQRLYSSKSESHEVYNAGQMLGPMSDIGPNSALYSESHGKIKFHFDSCDLLFGQECLAFKRLYPNLFAGINFARIKQISQSIYSNKSASTSRKIHTSSTFTGAGPQVGFDFNYRIIDGFFLTGTSALGLDIGSSQNQTRYYSNSPDLSSHGIPLPNTQEVKVLGRTQLVPSLEERLGFSYLGMFKCYKVKFGAGYQAQIYLNAIQTIDMTAPQVEPSLFVSTVPDSGVFAVGFERTLSNFILTGPYISLSVDF